MDQVNSPEGIGIGTGKAHTTDPRMVSGHDGLVSEGIRTRWPSVGRRHDMIPECRKMSGHDTLVSEGVTMHRK